jgi:arsenite methyltransferase
VTIALGEPIEALLPDLVEPETGAALRLVGSSGGDPELTAPDGRTYPVRGGIPRFTDVDDADQSQTRDSFGYKWTRVGSYGSEGMRESSQAWLVSRYGFADAAAMRAYFAGRRAILDLGCGSGFSASLWMEGQWHGPRWVGVDISRAIEVARDRIGTQPGTWFVQADALHLPFRDGAFDTVFSEGVLHHTPSTRRALASAARVLAPGGEILFYVYRRKSPVREFTDDHVRARLSAMSPEEAWEALRSLTELGRALAEIKAEVVVPSDVELLGIPKGTYDVQRLLYWHVAKLFWNDAFEFEENQHVNFDWYHPRYAHRQSEEEIRAWCAEEGLDIGHLDVQESGYTVRAIKVGRTSAVPEAMNEGVAANGTATTPEA